MSSSLDSRKRSQANSVREYEENNSIIDRFIQKEQWDVERIAFMDRIVLGVALSEIKNFDPAKTDFLSVLVDGVKIRKDCWNYYNLKRAKSIKLILEPQGDPFSWVMIIVTIAAAAYSAYLAHKLSAKTGGSTKTGNSIYDVNAQGNSVKLNEVIPEQFGMIKRFPDYIADTHKFYRNNKRILDLSLCQGVGKFHYSSSGSDMYFGATPFNQMSEKIQFKIYEPDETYYTDKQMAIIKNVVKTITTNFE